MTCRDPWYHDSITRREAEEKLQQSGKDGAFLVRKSDTVAGAYVLSLHMSKFIHHYRIRINAKGFFVTDCQKDVQTMSFDSLSSVIKYLMKNSQVGLPGALLYPISPDLPDNISSDEEEEDDVSSDSSDEEDETIKQCPVDLRKSLKKRSTIHHKGNKTLEMFHDIFKGMDLDRMNELDPEFVTLLERYVVTSAFWDIENLDEHGGTSCLQRLVEYSCRDMLKQLKMFEAKVEVLDKLVSGIAQRSGLEERLCEPAKPTNEELLDTTQPALVTCSQTHANLQRKMGDVFKHLLRSIRVSQECMFDRTTLFEAREGLRGKIQILVDPRKGTINLGKSSEYYHEQIKRLEKNYKDQNKMTILFMDNKKRDIIFDDTRTREEFFQTVSQIKHIHKSDTDVSDVSVYCCTWNMGEIEPVDDIINLFDEAGDHIVGFSNTQNPPTAHDIYAIGTQEADITEKDWVNQIIRALKRLHPSCNYVTIGTQSLMGIRLIVLVKAKHMNKVSSCETSSVKTGVGGMVGNKGAVGVSFHFGATMFAFVSCHLAARAERKIKRTHMYHEITRQLKLGNKSKYASFDLAYRFHHLFWMGDMNYRLDCSYQEVLEKIKVTDYHGLLQYDQLKAEQADGNIFYNFFEAEIKFPPTYRYRRGARDDYIYVKNKPTGNVLNVPSYCDRILNHSLPYLKREQTGYFCNLKYKNSDHAPVISTYTIGIKLQYVKAHGSDSDPFDILDQNPLKIRFPIVQAKIKSKSSDRYYLKFCSYVLEGTPHTKPAPRLLADYNEELNKFTPQASLSTCNVSHWGGGDIEDLEPILPNREYISNEHILIQVRSAGSDECYGQGILSMKDKVKSETIQPFRIMLTLNDEISGELRGIVCLSGSPPPELEQCTFTDHLTQPLTPTWNNPRRLTPSPEQAGQQNIQESFTEHFARET